MYSYGGGAFVVQADGFLVFTDARSQGLYRISPDGQYVDRVVLSSNTMYGDLATHPNDAEIVLAVRQIKSPALSQPEISFVSIHVVDKTETVLRQGSDFYSHPRFSTDGRMVCWLEWDHPHMPWTGARLYVASWCSGLAEIRRVGSHFGIGQPRWGANRTLFYCHDESGYQQLYYVHFGDDLSQPDPKWLKIRGLEECELAGAEFLLSSSTYFELEEGRLIVTYTKVASSQLAIVDCARGTYTDLDILLNDIAYDALQRINSRQFMVIGATSDCTPALLEVHLPDALEVSTRKLPCRTVTLAYSFDTSRIPEGTLSKPTPMIFSRLLESQALDGEPEASANIGHAFFMRPTNAHHVAGPDELPPCIIMAHGGPTRHHRPSINLQSQYFTSRGYAVVLLNHVGSTGYGKAYRDAMDGLWGVADVQDAVDCVKALVRDKLVDSRRVGITGPSAGGYLTLQAVSTHPDVWAGAVSIYGISDMRVFARTTHHFEKCYDFLLVRGRESLGEAEKVKSGRESPSDALTDSVDNSEAMKKLYDDRSPVTRAQYNKVPVLLLQGTTDCVVTPDQALSFAAAANRDSQDLMDRGVARKASGGPVELVIYEHEGHGFHLASTKKDSLERSERWWRNFLV